jgi:hypothetical protein
MKPLLNKEAVEFARKSGLKRCANRFSPLATRRKRDCHAGAIMRSNERLATRVNTGDFQIIANKTLTSRASIPAPRADRPNSVSSTDSAEVHVAK